MGATGPAGLTGEQGPMGLQGNIGPAGRAATVRVGEVHYIAPEDAPNVVNTGDSSDAVLEFHLPWHPAIRTEVCELEPCATHEEVIGTVNALIDALKQYGILL